MDKLPNQHPVLFCYGVVDGTVYRFKTICEKGKAVNVEDTVQFGELSPAARQKQFIAFAITVGNQRIAVMVGRLAELSSKNEIMTAVDKVEFDILMEDVKHISFQNELLKRIALDM